MTRNSPDTMLSEAAATLYGCDEVLVAVGFAAVLFMKVTDNIAGRRMARVRGADGSASPDNLFLEEELCKHED